MTWVVFGYRRTLGHVLADSEAEALAKARDVWGVLQVVYAEPCRVA